MWWAFPNLAAGMKGYGITPEARARLDAKREAARKREQNHKKQSNGH